MDIRHPNGNTRLIVRTWIIENLPQDSRILQEPYAAPLAGLGFQVDEVRSRRPERPGKSRRPGV